MRTSSRQRWREPERRISPGPSWRQASAGVFLIALLATVPTTGDIDLTWEAAPAGLRRGQAVQGKLELGGDLPATVLPAGPFLEASGGAWIFVLDADGKGAERRAVKLGRRTTETVEVLSGLKPGDQVVSNALVLQNTVEQ